MIPPPVALHVTSLPQTLGAGGEHGAELLCGSDPQLGGPGDNEEVDVANLEGVEETVREGKVG